jgi:hypothetical protein
LDIATVINGTGYKPVLLQKWARLSLQGKEFIRPPEAGAQTAQISQMKTKMPGSNRSGQQNADRRR